jgi:hypothetical protein
LSVFFAADDSQFSRAMWMGWKFGKDTSIVLDVQGRLLPLWLLQLLALPPTSIPLLRRVRPSHEAFVCVLETFISLL